MLLLYHLVTIGRSDTIDVTVHFVNDSANLDNWFISEGLEPNGNSINCLFEDQIFWHIDTFSTGNMVHGRLLIIILVLI